jgi:outer membrane protein assembly factor BamA
VLSEERRGRQQDLINNDRDFIAAKTRSEDTRTWGKVVSWSPAVSYREGSGVVLGLGPTITDFGFRRRPYESRIAVRGMVGGLSGRLGVQLMADRYFETSPLVLSVYAHASQLEVNRFYGFGNTTENLSRSESLVQREEFYLMPAISYAPDMATRISFGPVFRYVNDANYAQAGARWQFMWDRARRTPTQQRGLALQGGATLYPKLLDVEEQITTADALARLYVPIGGATLALRAGGQRVWGERFRIWDAAFLGGSTSLRGYAWNRFMGDASAYGGAELRIPLTRITLLTRGDLGLIGFTDAGRVWNDGVSEGNWHTGYGGGLFFGSLGQAVSVTYAQGEGGRFYLSFGQPF